jgi:hypothetical protein
MNSIQNVIDLFSKGGIEVTTFVESIDVPDEQLPLIRTVIQPNGSLITWVHSENKYEGSLDKHYDQLKSQIQSIKTLRQRLRTGEWAVAAVFVLFLNAFTLGWQLDVKMQVIRLLLTATAIFLFRYLFRYLIILIFRWYIRRKIQKVFPFPAGGGSMWNKLAL